MVEIGVASEDDDEAPQRLMTFLDKNGAKLDRQRSGLNAAVTDTWWRTYILPTGEQIELWYDIWTGTSLRGERDIALKWAEAFARSGDDG